MGRAEGRDGAAPRFPSRRTPDTISETMKPGSTARLAWSTGLATIALMVGALLLMFVDRHAALPSGATRWRFSDVLFEVGVVGVPAVVGIVLASRRPENAIGWLLLVQALALGLGLFGEVYGLHALLAEPGSLPAGRAIAWFSNWIYVLVFPCLAFLFLLFPTGHVPSRRWRPVA